MNNLLALKVGLVALVFAALFLAERLRPAAPVPAEGRGPGRLLRNGGLWLLNSLASPLVVVPLTAWAAAGALDWRPAWWSSTFGLVLDLVLLDGLLYWWHRACHEIPFLWRWHAVHHRDRWLDTTSAVRFHPGEVLLSALARAAVVVLLAVPLSSVLAFETLILLAALFHHSNLRLPPRLETALSRVVVTPSIHWVHHHARRSETDSNYATVLSLWDPLFRSRSRFPRRPDMPIGIEGEPTDGGLPDLLAQPFRRPAPNPGTAPV